MTNKIFIIAGWLSLAVFPASADQIILNEGKTLTGTIIDENHEEITINLAAHMVLRVERSKVKQIIRTPPEEKPIRPTFTMDDIKKKTAAKPMEMPSPLKNAEEGPRAKETKKDNVTLVDTVLYKSYTVFGPGVLKPHSTSVRFECTWIGTPLKEETEFKWIGLVVRSTTTVSMPRWDPLKTPEVAVLNQWNEAFVGLEKHAQGHIEIYSDTLSAIGGGLGSLRAANEGQLKAQSDRVVKDLMARAEKKQKGYDRREKSHKAKPALTTSEKKN